MSRLRCLIMLLFFLAPPTIMPVMLAADAGEQKLLRGYYLELSDSITAAIAEYVRYAQSENWDSTILNRIAYLRLQSGDLNSFLKHVSQKHDPANENDRYHFQLGAYHLEHGDLAAAREEFTIATTINPDNLEAAYFLASLFMDAEQFDSALVFFRNILEQDPEHRLTLYNVGEIYTRQRDYPNARHTYGELLRLEPGNASIIHLLGLISLEQGDSSAAVACFEQALAVDSGHLPSRFSLADFHTTTGDQARARNEWSALIDQVTSLDDLMIILNTISAAGEDSLSLEVFEKVNALHPRIPLITFELGKIHASLGHQEKAIAYFDQLRDAGQLEPQYLVYSALLKITLHRYDEAVADLRHCLTVPGLPERGICSRETVYENLALLYDRRKDYSRAAGYFLKLINAGNRAPALLNYVAYTLATRGRDLDTAVIYVSEALAAEPENPFYLDTLGWIRYRQNRLTEALAQIEKASRLKPDDPEILEHLGVIYWEMDDTRRALTFFSRALDIDPGRAVARNYLRKQTRKTGWFH